MEAAGSRARGGMCVAIRWGLLVSCSLSAATSAQAVIEMAGRWRLEVNEISTPESIFVAFTDATQEGATLTLPLPAVAGMPAETFVGPVEDDGEMVLSTGTRQLWGIASTHGDAFLGEWIYGDYVFEVQRVFGHRCDCDDGNLESGDGCSSTCQTEPCWLCIGIPSVCTPLGEGEACEDGLPCTTAGVCSAGLCSGAEPVASCTDMTGDWLMETTFFTYPPPVERQFTQSLSGTLVVRTSGRASFVGQIDPASRAFAIADPPQPPAAPPWCPEGPSVTAVVATNGRTYAGTGRTEYTSHATCANFDTVETGIRLPLPPVPSLSGEQIALLAAVLLIVGWMATFRLTSRSEGRHLPNGEAN